MNGKTEPLVLMQLVKTYQNGNFDQLMYRPVSNSEDRIAVLE